MELMKKLKDPELVWRFQKFCGIERKPKIFPVSNKVESDNKGKNNLRLRYVDLVQTSELHGDLGCQPRSEVTRSKLKTEEKNTDSDSQFSEEGSDAELLTKQDEYVVKNSLLYYLFSFGASLGNEIFYCSFFPYWFWNIDGYVGRRVSAFWCIFMYIGQATKDVIKWPRPQSPPVVRMEKRYAEEYGMPSTHAMVGAGVPFTVLYFCASRYDIPLGIGLAICTVWCAIVCMSRVYLGMHSVLDIIAGLIYVIILMPIFLPLLDILDEFALNHPFAPVYCIVIPLVLGICYPSLEKWSTCRGDTILILGVESGVLIGHWVAFQTGFMKRATTLPPYTIMYPSWTWFCLMVVRYFLGAVVLVGTRAVMKLVTLNTVCFIFGLNKKDLAVRQSLLVELPLKYLTYSVIAFNVVYTSPYLFRYLGVERETCYTEI